MALALAEDTLERFGKLTKFDLESYIRKWDDFYTNHYFDLVDFFNGDADTLNQESNSKFEELKQLSATLEDIILNIGKSLLRLDDWNLIEYIDELNIKLKVTDNISKFLRSAKYEGFNESSIAVDYTTSDFDTPESIAQTDRSDPQNDWVDIYVKNNVLETDYKAEEGGLNLQFGRRNLANLSLQTVVDNLVGDNVYGKDIDKEFVYLNDDLKVLSPRDTAKQSILVLARLQKGDIPENTLMGVSPDINIGSNLGLVSLPFLVRELKETFETDDTLIRFNIQEAKTEGSTLFISFEVETFFNLIVTDNIQIG